MLDVPMNISIQQLQRDLDHMKILLDRGHFYSLTPAEQQRLQEGTEDLSNKLALIESGFLMVGLLGGTGVGKSTLMNALAGEEIASASHRRPHTDRILIYRHLHAPLPALSIEDLPWGEVVHESNAVRQILLCDLPDFDSIVDEHRERVQQFLEHLDLLIWVTSPEKYGDGRFYEFLAETAKAPGNFIFVMNKLDLLFQGVDLETGYKELRLLIDNFRKHLIENGIAGPILYPLSAEEYALAHAQEEAHERAGEVLSPWNQLPAFRQHLFQQRDMKQIRSIKAANLDVEIRQLRSTLQKEALHLERFQEILEDLLKNQKKAYSHWMEAGKNSIAALVNKEIKADLYIHLEGRYPLIGPGSVFAYLMGAFQSKPTDSGPTEPTPTSAAISTGIAYTYKKRLEGLQGRLERTLLEKNLPSPFSEQSKTTLNTTIRTERLGDAASQVVLTLATNPTLPTFHFFRAVQWLTYLILFVLLLFAIGGDAWLRFFDDPSTAKGAGIVVSAVQTLFSSHGLAALLSYALLNLFFAIRFYVRYTRRLRRSTEKLRTSIQKVLLEVWEAETNELFEGLGGLLAETKERLSFLNNLHGDSLAGHS
jgi:GTP-binding protein EngB required for normal cell division